MEQMTIQAITTGGPWVLVAWAFTTFMREVRPALDRNSAALAENSAVMRDVAQVLRHASGEDTNHAPR